MTNDTFKNARYEIPAELEVIVTIRDGVDPYSRVLGSEGDAWREDLYDLATKEEIHKHWLWNLLVNRIYDVSLLDGWADLEPEDVLLNVTSVTFE